MDNIQHLPKGKEDLGPDMYSQQDEALFHNFTHNLWKG